MSGFFSARRPCTNCARTMLVVKKSPTSAMLTVCCTPDRHIDAAFNISPGSVICAAIEAHRHLGPGLRKPAVAGAGPRRGPC